MPPEQPAQNWKTKLRTLATHANKLAKETKIVSKGLEQFGFKRAAGMARMAGYGKRKKPKAKRGKRK